MLAIDYTSITITITCLFIQTECNNLLNTILIYVTNFFIISFDPPAPGSHKYTSLVGSC